MTLDPIALFTFRFSLFFPLFVFVVTSLVEALVITERLKIPLVVSIKQSIVMNTISLLPAIPFIFLPSVQIPMGITIHWTTNALLTYSSVIIGCYLISVLVESMVLHKIMKLDNVVSRGISFYANTLGYVVVVGLFVFFPKVFLVTR